MGSDVIYGKNFKNNQPEISSKDFELEKLIRLGFLYDVTRGSALTDHVACVQLASSDKKLYGDNLEMKKSVALMEAIVKVLEKHGEELYDQYNEVLANIDYYYVPNDS